MSEKTARLAGRTTIAPGVHVLELACVEPAALTWQPGQFISVRCPAAPGDARRSYTIVSTPARGERFELLVKDVGDGVGTAFFAGLLPGDEVHFTGPMGFFIADPGPAGHALLVATGAGVAAALPVLEVLGARGEPATLLWGKPDGQPSYWQDRLAPYQVEHVGGADWPTVHQALAARCLALLPGLVAPAVFYLVGNGDMCRRVRDALVAAGVDRRKQIRNEIFYPVMEGQK